MNAKTAVLLLAALTTMPSIGKAALQTPREMWTIEIGSGESERIRALAADSSGGVFVTGLFRSVVPIGQDTLSAVGGDDVFVAKVNSDGRVVGAWSRGSQWDDDVWSLASDGSNVYVAANIADSTFAEQFPAYRMLLAALADDGIEKWVFQPSVASNGRAIVSGVAASDGELIITGYVSGSATFGEIEVVSSGGPLGGSDILIVKLDTLGVPLWARTVGSPSADEVGLEVAIGPKDLAHVVGLALRGFDEVDDPCRIPGLSPRLWIGQLSMSGTAVREVCIQDPASGLPTSTVWDLAADSGGNTLVAGSYRGLPADSGLAIDSTTPLVLARLSAGQDPVWGVPSYVEAVNDVSIGASVASDKVHRVHLSRFQSFMGSTSWSLDGFDVGGNELYSVPTPGGGEITVSSTNDLYLATDNLLIKYDLSQVPTSASARSEPTYNLDMLSAYPNPTQTSTRIRFSLSSPMVVSLTAYDLLGRQIAPIAEGSFQPGVHEVLWRTEGLAGGVYFVRLIAQGILGSGLVVVKE